MSQFAESQKALCVIISLVVEGNLGLCWQHNEVDVCQPCHVARRVSARRKVSRASVILHRPIRRRCHHARAVRKHKSLTQTDLRGTKVIECELRSLEVLFLTPIVTFEEIEPAEMLRIVSPFTFIRTAGRLRLKTPN